MRTTVTLDPDVVDILDRAMEAKDVTFKAAINDAIRASAQVGDIDEGPFVQVTYSLGEPLVDLDKASQLAAELEDAEVVRKMELGK